MVGEKRPGVCLKWLAIQDTGMVTLDGRPGPVLKPRGHAVVSVMVGLVLSIMMSQVTANILYLLSLTRLIRYQGGKNSVTALQKPLAWT